MYIVIDKDGNYWGPFQTGMEAGRWADEKWPGGELRDDEDHGAAGWLVAALRPPSQ